MVYDNACAVVRMMEKKLRHKRAPPSLHRAWQCLRQLHWVIDRLHLRYHTGCQDMSSSWFVPNTDPASYSVLRGIDTEAAEQLFHVASRWQAGSQIVGGDCCRLMSACFCRPCSATPAQCIKSSFFWRMLVTTTSITLVSMQF